MHETQARPPTPPFDLAAAIVKVRKAEDAWNGKNPELVAKAYTEDSQWRNRSEFISGRAEIIQFLHRKWNTEQEYKLVKEIWAHSTDRIAVRFAYEWHDTQGQWFRSYGNENWAFDHNGLMKQRHASINDLAITVDARKFLWQTPTRPDDYPGLTELGL